MRNLAIRTAVSASFIALTAHVARCETPIDFLSAVFNIHEPRFFYQQQKKQSENVVKGLNPRSNSSSARYDEPYAADSDSKPYSFIPNDNNSNKNTINSPTSLIDQKTTANRISKWTQDDIVRLTPPTQNDSVAIITPPAPVPYPTSTFPNNSLATTSARARVSSAPIRGLGYNYNTPGGISLSKAAAERLSLKMNLEGISLHDGRVVFAGSENADASLDGALLLTALRLACEGKDPSFSLDAADGQRWSAQSQAASKELNELVKGRFSWDRKRSAWSGRNKLFRNGLTVKSYLATRDFADEWDTIKHKYPELRTNLVFRPKWLSQTRFGEIMYRADVLLKELSAGVSVLDAAIERLRARNIPTYIPASYRDAVTALVGIEDVPQSEAAGHRLWFDLMPQTGRSERQPINTLKDSEKQISSYLRRALKKQGYLKPAPVVASSVIYKDEGTLDLSNVYPRMYIRRHDLRTGEDLPGNSPNLDMLAADVNAQAAHYAEAYKELQQLTEIFRAYLMSVAITQQQPGACQPVRRLPLIDTEKVTSALPTTHPSIISLTVAHEVTGGSRSRRMKVGSSVSTSGGIALRGRQFARRAIKNQRTQFIERIDRRVDLALARPSQAVRHDNDLQFVTLTYEEKKEVPRAPVL